MVGDLIKNSPYLECRLPAAVMLDALDGRLDGEQLRVLIAFGILVDPDYQDDINSLGMLADLVEYKRDELRLVLDQLAADLGFDYWESGDDFYSLVFESSEPEPYAPMEATRLAEEIPKCYRLDMAIIDLRTHEQGLQKLMKGINEPGSISQSLLLAVAKKRRTIAALKSQIADLLLREDEQTDELLPCQRTQLENDIDAYHSMEWESLQVFVSDLLPPASDQPSPTQPT